MRFDNLIVPGRNGPLGVTWSNYPPNLWPHKPLNRWPVFVSVYRPPMMIWPLPAPILCFGHASFTPPSKIFSWFIEPCFSHDPHPFHQTTHLFIEPCFSIGPHPFHQTTNLFIQPCFFSLGYGLISSVVRSFVVSLKYTSHFFLWTMFFT